MKNDPDFADYDDDNVRDYIYHVYSSMNNVRELLTLIIAAYTLYKVIIE